MPIKNKAEKFDIVIAGGGPAGLMLAADLAQSFSVLVLEKGKAGTTTRAWYTFMDRVKANGLEEAVVARPRYLTFDMGNGHKFTYQDDHALINENRALEIFKKRAEKNGAIIKNGVVVNDVKNLKDRVIVKTNRGDYTGRLLIDAMGTRSPIVLKNKLQKNVAIWTVYGARIKARFRNPNLIGFYKIPDDLQPKNDKSNYVLGIYPKSSHQGDFYIFHYDTAHREPEYLKPLLEASLKKMFPKSKKAAVLRGWIYNGELKKYALDRIIFVGDSGSLAPPFVGMGFNENLRKHQLIAARLANLLQKNKLAAHSLSDVLSDYRNSRLITFQRLTHKYFFYGDDVSIWWSRGIDIAHLAGPKFVRAWMRNELTPPLMLVGLRSLLKLTDFKELMKLMPLKELLGFIGNSIIISGQSIIASAHEKYHREINKSHCQFCQVVKK